MTMSKIYSRWRSDIIPQWLASRPSCPGLDSEHSQKNFIEKIVDGVQVNQLCCFEKSGQWLENFDPTHLALASDKLVQQLKTRMQSYIAAVSGGKLPPVVVGGAQRDVVEL